MSLFFSQKPKGRRFFAWVCTTTLVMLISFIPARLVISSILAPQPQAIFTLGGGPEREQFTAEFARFHPDLRVWVSSGISQGSAEEIFESAGVNLERVKFDYRALDTIENFTTMAATFRKAGVQHVYLITSDFHMRRSRAIATIIFGSRGITVTPVPIASKHQPEPTLKVVMDIGRALIWLPTGWTGAEFAKDTKAKFAQVADKINGFKQLYNWSLQSRQSTDSEDSRVLSQQSADL
ncbi:MAG: YdcF family protein [Oscillatoriales cyanobacterium RM2_1_1]|nr:YdcF family protein [Oscillatoriales cyanobacterium SM2_3_0]NJO47834.1 YdcF family protein [Oscillatoriales cyanobacterium RM2_1_1]